MKNAHIITATPYEGESSPKDSKDGVIRLKIDKPSHWEWELTTSADTIPVIQLLDKDGRLLVETTGRTAQRARGSFRDGLSFHEEFPDPHKVPKVRTRSVGNRNFDGFSSKFASGQFGIPRKSRSNVDVRKEVKKSRKRDSSTESTSRTEGDGKKYSTGDYLRQQILNDLRNQSISGKTPDEIAKGRYDKVRLYLRNKSDSSLIGESREWTKNTIRKRTDRSESGKSRRRSLQHDRSLSSDSKDTSRGKKRLSSEEKLSNGSNTPKERDESLKREYNDTRNSKTSSEEEMPRNHFPQNTVNSFKVGKQLTKEDLEKIRGYLKDRISAKMKEEKLSRSRSQPIGTRGFPEFGMRENELSKRYSDCSSERKSYHISKDDSNASKVRFLENQLQPSVSRHNSESSSDLRRKLCSRMRVDALLEADEPENVYKEKKYAEKQRVYSRKTKSDTLVGNLDLKKSNSQSSMERSLKEYRDRKKVDSKLNTLEALDTEEEDFMKKPRWKDMKKTSCSVRNCRICENDMNCVDPFANREEQKSNENEVLNQHQAANDPDSKPKTRLQENYLVLERPTSPQHDSMISETTNNSREEEVSSSSLNSTDFGYNSIPKHSRDYKEILCSNSTVKKSDTFKVVDGSEDIREIREIRSPAVNRTSEMSCDSYHDLSGDIVRRAKIGDQTLEKRSNQEIAEDYLLRVYELLKKRKEEVKQLAQRDGSECEVENWAKENLKPRRRRRKKTDNNPQGEKMSSLLSGNTTLEARKSCIIKEFFSKYRKMNKKSD